MRIISINTLSGIELELGLSFPVLIGVRGRHSFLALCYCVAESLVAACFTLIMLSARKLPLDLLQNYFPCCFLLFSAADVQKVVHSLRVNNVFKILPLNIRQAKDNIGRSTCYKIMKMMICTKYSLVTN